MKLKRGQKSPEAAWRFLRTNERLKGVIVYLMKSKNLTPDRIEKASGISADMIRAYLRDSKVGTLTDFKLLKLCTFLGIELDLEITIK